MNSPDTAVKRMTAGAVLVVAAIAAVVSYAHIYHLTIAHGQPKAIAMLMPLSVDGTVATASSAMLWAARSNLSAPWLARVFLALGVAATLAANAAYGAAYGVTGELISGWPGIAFVGSVEIALGMTRRTRKRARVAAPASVTVPEAVPGPVRDEHAPVTGDAADHYAQDIEAGTLPSVRQIKSDMHVGTPRAQRILAQLTALAEA